MQQTRESFYLWVENKIFVQFKILCSIEIFNLVMLIWAEDWKNVLKEPNLQLKKDASNLAKSLLDKQIPKKN